MPWKETCTMDEREAFIDGWLSREFAMTELCTRFGVSRPTGYKWLERFVEQGRAGLADRSRATHTHPNATPREREAAVLLLKRQHPSWGPITLRQTLQRDCPEQSWPAASTIGELLKRHGLVHARRRRRQHTPPHTQPFLEVKAANDVWSADYKGQFRMGNGRLCYPLTITDNYSRYLLSCKGLYGPFGQATRACFERIFREYGLPRAIRTDNGTPFAGVALGGLSRVSIWLLKLTVLPERIAPGKPQQNGRHERMHRTLKAATANPPKVNMSAQQRAFNAFRHEYNELRPHRSLGEGRRPSDLFTASARSYPARLPEVEYSNEFTVRKVKENGSIRWNGDYIYVAKILAGEHVGLKPLGHDRWELYFAQLHLAVFDERTGTIIRPGKV
jgi:transposase InsO family protein